MSQTYVACRKCGQINRADVNAEKTPVCGSCQTSLPVHGALVEGQDKTLEKLIAKSPLPVIIDVWAPWCGPCRSFAPVFEDMSREFSGKAVFVKINSEENKALPAQWGVRGIPTLLVFKGGKEVARQAGAMPGEYFKQWVQQTI